MYKTVSKNMLNHIHCEDDYFVNARFDDKNQLII